MIKWSTKLKVIAWQGACLGCATGISRCYSLFVRNTGLNQQLSFNCIEIRREDALGVIKPAFAELRLNTDKTKIMVFFSKDTSAIPTFTYDGTPLELVNHFKYLGFTLTRDGSMHTAADKMADNLRLAIARVYRTGSSKGITHRKHAMLWLFQVFALTAGLYGCQVWATFSLTYDSSVTTRAHVLHLGFLKKLLGVKKGTDTHCVLRETGQMPVFFYWFFRCIIRIWNGLLSSNIPILEKLCGLTFINAKKRK